MAETEPMSVNDITNFNIALGPGADAFEVAVRIAAADSHIAYFHPHTPDPEAPDNAILGEDGIYRDQDGYADSPYTDRELTADQLVFFVRSSVAAAFSDVLAQQKEVANYTQQTPITPADLEKVQIQMAGGARVYDRSSAPAN